MAAGRGTRMLPLTNLVPKAMAPYNGTTLIANGIDKIKSHIPNIYITVGYKGSMLAQHVIEHNVTGIFNTEGKDNAWWIFNTLMKYINEPIFVLTCDNVTEMDFATLENEYFEFGQPACMLVPVKPVDGLEGDFIFEKNNQVYELDRYKKAEKYCSGIQILNPAKINSLMSNTDNFYNVWNTLIQKNQLYCSKTFPSKWFTVETVAHLNQIK
jgi:NDP-sugar pyrophosphorylase family protein